MTMNVRTHSPEPIETVSCVCVRYACGMCAHERVSAHYIARSAQRERNAKQQCELEELLYQHTSLSRIFSMFLFSTFAHSHTHAAAQELKYCYRFSEVHIRSLSYVCMYAYAERRVVLWPQ